MYRGDIPRHPGDPSKVVTVILTSVVRCFAYPITVMCLNLNEFLEADTFIVHAEIRSTNVYERVAVL